MKNPILSDRAKAQVLNSVLDAEVELVDAIRNNVRNKAAGFEIRPKDKVKEKCRREIYAAMYSLAIRLDIAEFYDEWRDCPVEFDENDEGVRT